VTISFSNSILHREVSKRGDGKTKISELNDRKHSPSTFHKLGMGSINLLRSSTLGVAKG
jgi:hypothetical protein